MTQYPWTFCPVCQHRGIDSDGAASRRNEDIYIFKSRCLGCGHRWWTQADLDTVEDYVLTVHGPIQERIPTGDH